MKRITNKVIKVASFLSLACMVIAVLAFVLPVETVSAQDIQDDPQPPAGEEAPGVLFVERIYQRTIRFSEHVARDYERLSKISERGNNLIERLNEHGKDPTPVSEALGTFESSVAQGQPELEKAQGILAAHNGFDENGKLTDKGAARQTLKDAREALKNAHQTFHRSARTLIQAIREYRASLLPPPTPESPSN